MFHAATSLLFLIPTFLLTSFFNRPNASRRNAAMLASAWSFRTRLRSSSSNLDYFVLRISDHPFPMTVEEPAELREAFRRAASRMAAAAGAASAVAQVDGSA